MCECLPLMFALLERRIEMVQHQNKVFCDQERVWLVDINIDSTIYRRFHLFHKLINPLFYKFHYRAVAAGHSGRDGVSMSFSFSYTVNNMNKYTISALCHSPPDTAKNTNNRPRDGLVEFDRYISPKI